MFFVLFLLHGSTLGKASSDANINKTPRSPLHLAARMGSIETIQQLLDTGTTIDAADEQHRTALHHATAVGQSKTVAFLLDHGADPNAQADLNITPLHLAAMGGKTEIAGLLTRRGARVSSRTRQGLTSLHLAADDRMVNCLVDAGADINALSDQGLTPLHTARQSSVARALLDRGADLRIRTPRGQTAMELASVESLETVGGFAIHSVMLGRLRGLLGQMPLSITNISESPIEQVVVTALSPACAITITPPAVPIIQSGERVNLTMTMTRNSDLAEGEHRIDLTFSANHHHVGQIDLRVDTRMHETPGDKGMIRLAKGNLRPAPSRWQYLAYAAVPILVLVGWWFLRRREP
jgi:ankyrin repeat protein